MHRQPVSHRLQGRRQFSLTFARSILVTIGKIAVESPDTATLSRASIAKLGFSRMAAGGVDVITMLSKQQEDRRDE